MTVTSLYKYCILLFTSLIQEELLHNSDELKTLLHTSVQEQGWCQHVPSLLHSDTSSPTEKALQVVTNVTFGTSSTVIAF